jgi:hypothetical protein
MMNLEYRSLLPKNFAPDSRVWVYQSARLFTMSEAIEIEDMLNHFVANWNSHGTPVKGFGTLFFGRFIILVADESSTGVSGCSTDSSVRLVKSIEQKFSVNLFDRQNLAFVRNEKIELIPLGQFKYAAENGFIGPETLYFNNLVQTKSELEQTWLIPVKESWLASRMPVVS